MNDTWILIGLCSIIVLPFVIYPLAKIMHYRIVEQAEDSLFDSIIDEQIAKEKRRLMTTIDESLTLQIQRIADKDFEGDYNAAHDFLLRSALLNYLALEHRGDSDD